MLFRSGEEDIRIAVVVVVENRHPASHRLRRVALGSLATLQPEIDRAVNEVDGRRGVLPGSKRPGRGQQDCRRPCQNRNRLHGRSTRSRLSFHITPSASILFLVFAFVLRVDNLTVDGAARELALHSGVAGTLEWRGRIASLDAPWVAVVVPDDDLTLRKEVLGAAWER